jgi:hypothetical protein
LNKLKKSLFIVYLKLSSFWLFVNRFLETRVWTTIAGALGFGGTCPWCGSSKFLGRQGFQLLTCKSCQVTFNTECPICKHPNKSLGFSQKFNQWGCDRCGFILSHPEKQVILEKEQRLLWLTSYGFQSQLLMARLTISLIFLTAITVILLIIFK